MKISLIALLIYYIHDFILISWIFLGAIFFILFGLRLFEAVYLTVKSKKIDLILPHYLTVFAIVFIIGSLFGLAEQFVYHSPLIHQLVEPLSHLPKNMKLFID